MDQELLITADNWERYLEESSSFFNILYKKNYKSNLSIDDFILIQTVGHGAFSKLIASKLMMDGKMYLIEARNKKEAMKYKMVSCILEEKRILQGLTFSFCTSLAFAFQDNCYLYKCLPFVNGGCLLSHLKNFKKFDEPSSVFVAAQVVLALEYLHYLGLIFRNLSPDNVFLDGEGYVKLQGFAFCKKLSGRTYTLCGKLAYLAPEILLTKGYGVAVDWWALGVLLYEINSGSLPFAADEAEDLMQKILACEYEIPPDFSEPLKSLVGTLIEPDLTKRCGSSLYTHPATYIKSHPWFEDYGRLWMELFNRKLQAPFVPKVCGPDDLTHFQPTNGRLLEFSEYDEYGTYFKDF